MTSAKKKVRNSHRRLDWIFLHQYAMGWFRGGRGASLPNPTDDSFAGSHGVIQGEAVEDSSTKP
jgi:hypothetical protein